MLRHIEDSRPQNLVHALCYPLLLMSSVVRNVVELILPLFSRTFTPDFISFGLLKLDLRSVPSNFGRRIVVSIEIVIASACCVQVNEVMALTP